MKQTILLIGVVLCGNAWAEYDYGTALTNMVWALEQPRATLDASFTNRLSTWVGEATNVSHVANIELVRAISYADIAEDDMSGDTLLPQIILNLLKHCKLCCASHKCVAKRRSGSYYVRRILL